MTWTIPLSIPFQIYANKLTHGSSHIIIKLFLCIDFKTDLSPSIFLTKSMRPLYSNQYFDSFFSNIIFFNFSSLLPSNALLSPNLHIIDLPAWSLSLSLNHVPILESYSSHISNYINIFYNNHCSHHKITNFLLSLFLTHN